MLRGIRARLLGLVITPIISFAVLICVGLWEQRRSDQDFSIHRALDEPRLLGTQADDILGVLSVGLPTEMGLARLAEDLNWIGLFALAVVLVSAAIAWMLSGHMVGSIRRLRKDNAMLAAREVSRRNAVRWQDEVGGLADGMNRIAAEDLRQAKDTLAAVIDASPVAIVCSDPERRIFLWNRAAEEIFGYSAEEASGQFADLIPPKQKKESQNVFKRALGGETVQNVRMKRLRKDGTAVDVRMAAAPMYNPDGTVRGVARAYEDITKYVQAEQQLDRLAHWDQLTGLPNRLSLQKQLSRLLAKGCNSVTAIALFDLDGFKDVNDTLGHSTGDQLLIEVGRRLSEIAGAHNQVCRLGGDEFVVIFPNCGDRVEVGKGVETMLARLKEPFTINDHNLNIDGSSGIAIAPADGLSVDELIANADLALYQAKAEGGRTFRFFLPVLRTRAQARRNLLAELRRAFEQDEFELYFQPQVRIVDETVVGAETLIRWRHPQRGILAPGAFIETLAASTIAPGVGRWIMRTACAYAAQWRAAGLSLDRVGVNLFPVQLGDAALLTDIDEALRETGLPANVLELEITENVALNFKDTELLQKLRARGVKLAFDDFGTGYASLSYLTKFPLSRIKIDRSFILRVTDNADDAAIVRSLIAMAHNLGLEVIAEGVETAAQAAFLLDEHCEEAQGYLFDKPMPAKDFETYLKNRSLLFEAATMKPLGHQMRIPRRSATANGRRGFLSPSA